MRLPCLPKAEAKAEPRTPAPTTMISKDDPSTGTGTVAKEGERAYWEHQNRECVRQERVRCFLEAAQGKDGTGQGGKAPIARSMGDDDHTGEVPFVRVLCSFFLVARRTGGVSYVSGHVGGIISEVDEEEGRKKGVREGDEGNEKER